MSKTQMNLWSWLKEIYTTRQLGETPLKQIMFFGDRNYAKYVEYGFAQVCSHAQINVKLSMRLSCPIEQEEASFDVKIFVIN